MLIIISTRSWITLALREIFVLYIYTIFRLEVGSHPFSIQWIIYFSMLFVFLFVFCCTFLVCFVLLFIYWLKLPDILSDWQNFISRNKQKNIFLKEKKFKRTEKSRCSILTFEHAKRVCLIGRKTIFTK